MAGGLVAQAYFYAVDAVDGGVAGRGATEDFNVGAGQEAEVGEVVTDLFGEVYAFDDSAVSYLRVAQWSYLGVEHIGLLLVRRLGNIRPSRSSLSYGNFGKFALGGLRIVAALDPRRIDPGFMDGERACGKLEV